jgi:hypothetical protein
MPQYEINVRAIVEVVCLDTEASCDVPGWETYDVDVTKRDENGDIYEATIRCDQLVRVEADDEETARESAKEETSAIKIEGYWTNSVSLWVDEDIDVTLAEPVSVAP